MRVRKAGQIEDSASFASGAASAKNSWVPSRWQSPTSWAPVSKKRALFS